MPVTVDQKSEELKAVEEEIAAAAAAAVAASATPAAAPTPATEAAAPNAGEAAAEEIQTFPIIVKTLDGAQLQITVSRLDTIQEVKQYLFEAKSICYVTSYHLEYEGKKVNDFIDLGSLNLNPNDGHDIVFQMVEAPYDDRSARQHVRRLRDLLATANVEQASGSPSLFSRLLLSEPDDPFAALESATKEQLEKRKEERQGKKSGKGKQQKKEKEAQNGASTASTASKKPSSVFDPRDFEPSRLHNAKLSEYYPPTNFTPLPQPVKSIIYSGWNPPPSYRKLAGDLFYLEITTQDGRVLHVTAGVNGFFVNASSERTFNPAPSPAYPGLHSHTLVGLLSSVVSNFQKTLDALIEAHFAKHPFEVLPVPLPVIPWVDTIKKHEFDSNRAEDALLLTSDNDVVRGQLRDWNEEFQGCKELPKKSVQDRIFRDRALIKVTYDFVDTATKGAIAIVNKTIPPLNPLDSEKSFMFIYNNIFFSYALDARDFYKDAGGDRAAHIAANNDLKGVMSYNQADIDGLHTLLTAIIDYRGYRVVAQSIVPGILLREQTSTVHYGSMDHGATISGNEDFHKLMLEAGKKLHIKEHELTDEKGNKVKLCSPMECKGIIGTDNRKYILDLIRTTPRDANWTTRDIDDHSILRPELIIAYLEYKADQKQKEEAAKEAAEKQAAAEKKEEGTEKEETPKEPKELELPEIYFNPDTLVKNAKVTDPEETVKEDTDLLNQLAQFLVNTIIPNIVEQMAESLSCPMEGKTLSQFLHAQGVNIRYLGKIATLAKSSLPFFTAFCEREMIARAAKYIFNSGLRELDTTANVTSYVSRFLNALLGASASSSTSSPATSSATSSPATNGTTTAAKKKKRGKKTAPSAAASTTSTPASSASSTSEPEISPSTLWASIRESVKEKFQYELPYEGTGRPAAGTILPLALLRSFVQKVGVQIESKDYDFTSERPFAASNILDLYPIVKHTNPRSADGVDLLNAGRVLIHQLPAAFELITEALAIFHQVCGPMHPDTATCYAILAQVLVGAGDVVQALIHLKKAVVINERVVGLDHHETIQGYFMLAVFSHQLGYGLAALNFLKRAIYLSTLSSGLSHPDTISFHLNLANMLRDHQQHSLALTYFQEAQEGYEAILGTESPMSAALAHEIALQYSYLDDFKNALLYEKRNYAILKKLCGENDQRTQESSIWLKQFTAKAVQMLIEAKKTQREIINSIEEVRTHHHLRRGGAAASATAAGGRGGVAAAGGRLGGLPQGLKTPAGTPVATTATAGPSDLGSRPLSEILQYIYGETGNKRRGGASSSSSSSSGESSSNSSGSTRGGRRPPFRGPFFRAGSAGPSTKSKRTGGGNTTA